MRQLARRAIADSETTLPVPGIVRLTRIARGAEPYTTEIVEGAAALRALGPEWRDLEGRADDAATIFQSFAWCDAAAAHASKSMRTRKSEPFIARSVWSAGRRVLPCTRC